MFAETSIVHKARPVYYEGIFLFLVGFLIVGNMTVTDIIFHDSYVLPDIALCHESNQGEVCTEIRQRMGLSSDAHGEIGNIYWQELARQGIMAGVIMFVIRMGFALFLKVGGVRMIRPATIMMAIFWGLIGSSLFMFGFLDTFYYWFVLQTPPDELAWLNEAGFFAEAKSWTGDPELVEIEDLYLLNIMGIILLSIYLYIIMYTYAKSGLSNRGLA